MKKYKNVNTEYACMKHKRRGREKYALNNKKNYKNEEEEATPQPKNSVPYVHLPAGGLADPPTHPPILPIPPAQTG